MFAKALSFRLDPKHTTYRMPAKSEVGSHLVEICFSDLSGKGSAAYSLWAKK